jgi:hypothetical protein
MKLSVTQMIEDASSAQIDDAFQKVRARPLPSSMQGVPEWSV